MRGYLKIVRPWFGTFIGDFRLETQPYKQKTKSHEMIGLFEGGSLKDQVVFRFRRIYSLSIKAKIITGIGFLEVFDEAIMDRMLDEVENHDWRSPTFWELCPNSGFKAEWSSKFWVGRGPGLPALPWPRTRTLQVDRSGENSVEKTCDGSCEPMCAWCNRQADIAAENREME